MHFYGKPNTRKFAKEESKLIIANISKICNMQKQNQKVPKISAILPVYNCEAYVRESVESILKQNFTDFELIIINDGSTDSSGEILRELAKKDSRIVLVERINKGLIFSLNEAIVLARAAFIARMDADDIAMPDRFKLQYARISAEPNLAVLGSAVRTINSDGELLGYYCHLIKWKEIQKFCEEDCPVVHPTVLMRKDVVINVGGYRHSYQYCEDFDLWLRIIDNGYRIANLAKPLLSYRVHGSNVSKLNEDTQRFNAIVARLSHRMRKAGLSDPTIGLEKIEGTILKSFPSHVTRDIDTLCFIVRYTDISSKTKAELHFAWKEYQHLEDSESTRVELSRFLFRLICGAIKNRDYMLATQVGWEALSSSPVKLIKRVVLKAKVVILIRLALI